MIKFERCNNCEDVLNKAGVCSCERFFVEERKCPECGALIYSHNDPSQDNTLGEYCSNIECKYMANQYMTWDEIKSSCAIKSEEDCINCFNCLDM